MTGDELVAAILALPPEQRAQPVVLQGHALWALLDAVRFSGAHERCSVDVDRGVVLLSAKRDFEREERERQERKSPRQP